VAEIARRQQIAATKRFGGATDKHSVHDDFAAGWKILGYEFVFRGHVREQDVLVAR
jgi:hypothetical protein